MPHETEHDRLRAEAIQALRRAQLCLRKLSTDGTNVEPARASIREASNIISRIRRTPPGIRSTESDLGRFDPLREDHPAVGWICPGCGQPLEVGDRPAMVNGEPADEAERLRQQLGRSFTSEVKLAHEVCAFQKEKIDR